MKTMLSLAAILTLAVTGYADDQQSRERRVKVALALSAGPAIAADGCGICLDNEDEARGLARAQNKPLVLFIGGCGGAGEWAVGAGAVSCRVARYTGDDRPAAEPRIVILSPRDDDKWTLYPTLPAGAKTAEILKVVGEAKPPAKAKEPEDWFIGAEAKPLTPNPSPAGGEGAILPTAAPVKTYTYCTKTGCYTVIVK